MKLGFSLLNNWGVDQPQALVDLACRAEEAGIDSVWVHDHVFNVGHVFDRIGGRPYYEPLTLLTYVAARTRRVRLGTSVLVLPYHNPVRLAKAAATLDVLSGGRLVVGVGAGWLKSEFDAVVTTPFPERGKVTDEYIDAFRLLWTEHSPRFDGRYTKIDGIVLEPKPVQKPHPPIWVGGEGPAALRRAARIGNAWYPIGSNNQHLLDTLPRLKAGIAKLRKATTDAGRDPQSVEVAFRVKRYGAAVPAKASDGERRLFSGSEADLIGDLRALKEMGVTAIDIDFGRPTADAVLAEMNRFRKAVIDKV